MKQEFELTQTNTTKVLLVLFGGLAALLLVAFQGANMLGIDKGTPALVWFIGIIGVGFVGLYRTCKAAGAVPTLVTVGLDRLLILKTQASEETQIAYAQIAAYRASSFNGNEELRLTLRDGSRRKVAVSTQLYGAQAFGAMLGAFEAAIQSYQQPAGSAQAVVRERTFFEKPISTFVLVAFTAFFVWIAWIMIINNRHIRGGGLISAFGSYAAYIAAWLAARERRNEK